MRKTGLNCHCKDWVPHVLDLIKDIKAPRAYHVAKTDEEKREQKRMSKLKRIRRLEQEACGEENW